MPVAAPTPARATALACALAFALAAALAAPHLTAQATHGPAAGPAPGAAADPAAGSADWYDLRAREAVERHGYEAAAKLLGEAKRVFPDDARFNLSLASLYYGEQLWRLALDEYLVAERKGAADAEGYARIARCLGKLDANREAVGWLERATEKWPGDAGLADDLGWMYFKVHRYADGVRLLEAAVQTAGMSADLAMTLGTLSSGMGDYAESSRYYRTAIELSAGDDSRYFASIAWYNLSLLERRFYHYRAAFQATEESLAGEDLASGHLARGELLESRMDYRGALAEYGEALAQDDTPLAGVSLAVLHRRFGRLDLALRYAEEALADEDPAWLLYFGSDVAHYRLDVHESLADIHEGMARLALGRPTAGPFARCRALLSAAVSALRGWYHRQRTRLYAAEVGRAYLAEGAEEDGAFHLAMATEAYPRISLKYLELARAVETARAPHAEALYRIDEGSLCRSAGMIREAIEGLDPVWERRFLADAFIEIAPLAAREGDREGRREAINRLFAVNPGALAPEGLGLPLVPRFVGGWTGRERRAVRRLLRRSGSELADDVGGGFRYLLTLERSEDGRVGFALAEGDAARPVAEGAVEPTGGPRRRAADVVAAVLAECYAVE
jgi:tetratricopeptide (TPR) repeat protein